MARIWLQPATALRTSARAARHSIAGRSSKRIYWNAPRKKSAYSKSPIRFSESAIHFVMDSRLSSSEAGVTISASRPASLIAPSLCSQEACMKEKPKVLILCTGHPERSEMAEGFLRQLAGDKLTPVSAAIEPAPVSALAVDAMKEVGIDISQQQVADA